MDELFGPAFISAFKMRHLRFRSFCGTVALKAKPELWQMPQNCHYCGWSGPDRYAYPHRLVHPAAGILAHRFSNVLSAFHHSADGHTQNTQISYLPLATDQPLRGLLLGTPGIRYKNPHRPQMGSI